MILRPADAADHDAVAALLSGAGLPAEDIGSHLADFIVAEEAGTIVGVAGLERVEGIALARSLAVAPAWRGHGLGARLLSEIEVLAVRLGISTLYTLTTTVADYLQAAGYRLLPRDEAPDAIRGTRQFQGLCPASAVLLVKDVV